MEKIIKNSTSNESEKMLSILCEKTFLKLWSYPSPFRDEGKKGNGDGKEICDFLVAFQNKIIIFSDKYISYKEDIPDNVSWCRWKKKAIDSSIKQLRGAEKWIKEHPSRIFLDKHCKLPFPFVDHEKISSYEIHLVAIANGLPNKKLINTNKNSSEIYEVCGHIDNSFYHIFDTSSFNIIAKELDTVTDFTTYLSERKKILSSDALIYCNAEENLLAEYLLRHDEKNSIFNTQNSKKISSDNYIKLTSATDYTNGKIADQPSYIWDYIIDHVAQFIMDNSLIVHNDMPLHEKQAVIEKMASYSRLERRSFGANIIRKYRETPPGHISSFASYLDDHLFVYIIFPFKFLFINGITSYEEYLNIRLNILSAYCTHYYAQSKMDVIGIITDNHDNMVNEHNRYTTQAIFEKSMSSLYRKKMKSQMKKRPI